MKNILALGICLAAFNAYAQDSEDTMTQDMSEIAIETETRFVAIEEIDTEITTKQVTTEEVAAEQSPEEMTKDVAVEAQVEETFLVTTRDADGVEVQVEAKVITLAQTKKLFNTPEAAEFFATKGITSAEAFDSIVALLTQIQNKTIEVEGNTVALDGISLTINEHNYFIKSSEFITLENESDLQN